MKKILFISLAANLVGILLISIYLIWLGLSCDRTALVRGILENAESSNQLAELELADVLLKHRPARLYRVYSDEYEHIVLVYGCQNGFVEIDFYTQKNQILKFTDKTYLLSAARYFDVKKNGVDYWWVGNIDMYTDRIIAGQQAGIQ